ncbi:MAG: D-glycerate dehydrogenase [Chloroflexi bacterium]|nr:D-glycerate dehydrogenase [Chloroflexota bacterium]
MAAKVLVTRRQFEDQMDRLRSEAETIVLTRPAPATREELLHAVKDCTGIFAHITDRIDADVMDAAGSSLRVIAEFGVGYDNIDTAAASERNIAVGNTPGVLTETAADFTFALIQSAGRRLTESDRFVRRGEWKWFDPLDLLGLDINGSKLGIVGLGRIGSAVARRALASGMEVIYFNRNQPADDLGCRRAGSLDELLAESDFVSLHCPLTPETYGLIGSAQLKTMQSHAVLVNTARGPIVDTDALTEALRSGAIASAALDVTDPEPIPAGHPLLRLENVTLLPHIASATVGTRKKMSQMTVDNILAVLRGELPPNCVNSEHINWS